MDRYELQLSMDEIDRLIEERQFAQAADVADEIDWTRVRGTHILCKISDLYKINKRYRESRDLMQMAYDRNPSGRKIIYSLCELELQLNNYIHALQLYTAFINVAPKDPDRYLLQYKLYKKQDVNVNEQIIVLEEFLQRDFREKWAYELASLYLRAGDQQRCIRQCDEIIAYFGEGRFVVRALELKKSLTALTPQQEERLAELRAGRRSTAAPEKGENAAAPEKGENAAAPAKEESAPVSGVDSPASAVPAAAASQPSPVPREDDRAAAANEGSRADSAGEPHGAEDADNALPQPEEIPVKAENPPAGDRPAPPEMPAPVKTENISPEEYAGVYPPEKDGADTDREAPAVSASETEEYSDALMRGADQQLRDANMQETIARGMRELDDTYDDVLAQETSGQLTMVMEDEPGEEIQVEGQLNLEQIMSEWEKIRRDSEQQRMAEARRRVLEVSSAAKRQLYGDDFEPAGDDMSGAAGQPQDPGEKPDAGTTAAGGTTRSWKREDVEKGLRRK